MPLTNVPTAFGKPQDMPTSGCPCAGSSGSESAQLSQTETPLGSTKIVWGRSGKLGSSCGSSSSSQVQLLADRREDTDEGILYIPSSVSSKDSSSSPDGACAQIDLTSEPNHVVWGKLEKSESSHGSSSNRLVERDARSEGHGQNVSDGPHYMTLDRNSDVAHYHDLDEEFAAVASASKVGANPSASDTRPHMGGQWSIGSKDHAVRQCWPCAWAWRPGGCYKGMHCDFCHLCEDGAIQRQRKERKKAAKGRALLIEN
eukprot:TRINITY_DN66399_c0_g1_i1.p1 TRINITY_DN66399_c0_g1~~TRINITY_DN66399_c0_g1_i1.p1  ORF type:complete len:277 (-),score=17.21 TRINITY_DN66399_c0_g1_i1:179-952(-)